MDTVETLLLQGTLYMYVLLVSSGCCDGLKTQAVSSVASMTEKVCSGEFVPSLELNPELVSISRHDRSNALRLPSRV